MAVIYGTSASEILNGSFRSSGDWMDAGAGNDSLWGGLGNDTYTGGSGFDMFSVHGVDTILDLGLGGKDMVYVNSGSTVYATVVSSWSTTNGSSNYGTAYIYKKKGIICC
jgi:Ca2+-binding RTX toxin-like protein